MTTIWSGTQGNRSNWLIGNNAQLDPANYYLNGLFQDWNDQQAKQFAWRGDGTFDFQNDFFQYADFGVRYSDHKAEYHGSVDISTAPPGGTGSISDNPNPANQVIARFPNGYFCNQPTTPAIPVSWLSGCYNYLMDNKAAIRSLYGLDTGQPGEDNGRFYQIKEQALRRLLPGRLRQHAVRPALRRPGRHPHGTHAAPAECVLVRLRHPASTRRSTTPPTRRFTCPTSASTCTSPTTCRPASWRPRRLPTPTSAS